MTKIATLLTIIWILCSGTPPLGQNNNAVIPGDFIVEPSTLINLGFAWKIKGADTRNATVAVQYRKAGESQWREALPLLRIGDEKVWRRGSFWNTGRRACSRAASSILKKKPVMNVASRCLTRTALLGRLSSRPR